LPETTDPKESPPSQRPLPVVRPSSAVLYEEGGKPGGTSFEGTVLWRTESASGGEGHPFETALRGEVTIPGRNLKASFVLRRNTDSTLPASHMLEVQFTLPANFANAGIAKVPGINLKTTDLSQGERLAGASVRVMGGFFLIGLSGREGDRAANEQLLRGSHWIDIPIIYDNGRRAALTLEKGEAGKKAFSDALSAWETANRPR
jgi:hypothetical protein